MGDQSENKAYKIVIVGGGGVGKSCVTLRFLHDFFEEKYNPTIEDSYTKPNFIVDGEAHSIEIFDTAGQDIYKSMIQQYYNKGHGFLIVYSVTDSSSLQDARDKYQDILEETEATPETCKPVMLIGNKCDLEDSRVISKDEGQAFAYELGKGTIGHQETSAKSNINVTEVFEEMIRMIVKKESEDETQSKKSKKKKKEKKNPCVII